ncbi:J domain-containing protein [bacterium]|nr:MAG: J domain-containing protein [bacterium]
MDGRRTRPLSSGQVGRVSNHIANACRILFGPGVKITSQFVKSLNHADLKETYRKRAKAYHPDRAVLAGKEASLMNERLKNVNLAYECLSSHILENSSSKPPSSPSEIRGAISPLKGSESGFWNGPVPHCELFIGQYLFYSGLITWGDFVEAVSWQRKQRPIFGKIATMWDYFSHDESEKIAANTSPEERIGDSALRQGYLTPYQCKSILEFQRWLQTPFGQYFIERGILTEDEVNQSVKALKVHNAKVLSSNQ